MAFVKSNLCDNSMSRIPNVFCHTCLSTDRTLWPLMQYKDICEKLFAHIKLILPLDKMMICWECAAYLKNVTRFLKRTTKSQLLLYGSFIENKIKKLKSQSNLSETKNTHSEVIVYNEPVIIDTTVPLEDKFTIKEELKIDFKEELDDFNYDSPLDSTQNIEPIQVSKSKPKKEKQQKNRKIGADKFKITRLEFSFDNYKEIEVDKSFFKMLADKEKEKKEFLDAKFRCDSCVLIFNDDYHLKRHNKRHEKTAGNYICDICETMHKTEGSLKYHLSRCHSMYECQLCSENIKKDNRITHFKNKHKLKIECLDCGACFRYMSFFTRHYEGVHLSIAICDYCGKSFPKKRALREHISLIHMVFKCEKCDITFKNRKTYWTHNAFKHKTASNDEAYCVECDIKFNSVLSFKRHLTTSVKHKKKEETNPIPVKCPLCEKVYARKTFMMNHYRLVHLKKTRHYCADCDKYFLTQTRIREHMWYVHEGRQKKLNKICYICGRGFNTTRILVHHIHTHTGERPHSCPHCPAKFVQKYAMKTHIKTIHLKMKGTV